MSISNSEKIADKLVREYLENWRNVYKDFSLGIELILKTLLLNSSVKKYQTSCREKDYRKLKKKIIHNGYEKLSQVKDLAGCRILFYVQDDIELFKKYLFEEFKVESTKLHYPFSNESKNKVYYGEHLYIKLKENRLKIPEYKRFKNLLCEIQLTTVLYHSSSELEHDISYNPPEKVGTFYKEDIDILKNRFADVLKKYIKPAQGEFDDIWKRFNSISEGKRMFGYDFTHRILNPKSINDLYSDLNFLKNKVELFKGKLPDNIDLFKIIRNSLEVSKKFKAVDIDTAFGKVKGQRYNDVLSLCLEIINYLKFKYSEEFFELLIELYENNKKDQKKKIVEILASFSKNDYHILQKIGYQPKKFILGKMEKWNKKELAERTEIVLNVSKNLLNPSFEGTSMKDYKTMVFSSGPLKATVELTNIRKRTLKLLMGLYFGIKRNEQRKEILSTIDIASQTPHQGVYGDDMEEMARNNAKYITDFFIKILPKSNNEIISKIEEQMKWLYKRFGEKKLPALEKLKNSIDNKKEYKIYRVLVGYEDRFSEKLSWEECRKVRTEKINEFICEINEENFAKWKRRIFDIIHNYRISDPGGYQYLNIFLSELAKQKPEFALKILETNKRIPLPFLVALISGLLRSNLKDKGRGIIQEWIKKGVNLDIIANVFSYDVEVDKEIVLLLFKKARKKKNINALNGIIRILANNYPKFENKKLFLDTIRDLTFLKNHFWVNDVWHQKDCILDSLSETDYRVILDNLLLSSRIDYHTEEILAHIAKSNPKLVVDFFFSRIKIYENKKKSMSYDAIPYDLHELENVLVKDENVDVVIKEVLKWFEKDGWMYGWSAANLLQIIFPGFGEKFERALLDLIKEGGENNAKIVGSILDKYDGQIFLHNVCKEFIRKYPSTKDYTNEVIHILSKTGTVMGEYGFMDAYKKKREEIQIWKKEKDKKILSFLKEYESYLDKQIKYEQKRADEQIESRKRNFE
ncbi:MAG: hypothetical protein ACD_7C00522G0004 [uncultured bacterium]|nr:MAG: hypothetical protein ACD_7C00522G0004 [uncultured bacterium]